MSNIRSDISWEPATMFGNHRFEIIFDQQLIAIVSVFTLTQWGEPSSPSVLTYGRGRTSPSGGRTGRTITTNERTANGLVERFRTVQITRPSVLNYGRRTVDRSPQLWSMDGGLAEENEIEKLNKIGFTKMFKLVGPTEYPIFIVVRVCSRRVLSRYD